MDVDRRPVLGQLNLIVTDMDRSVEFYRRLGLDIPDSQDEWRQRHRTASQPDGVDLDLDSGEFARTWNKGWKASSGAVIGFRVTSREAVDELHRDMVAAGYTSQQAPYDAFWGARYAVIEDPDGNAVGLMSPRESGRQA